MVVVHIPTQTFKQQVQEIVLGDEIIKQYKEFYTTGCLSLGPLLCAAAGCYVTGTDVISSNCSSICNSVDVNIMEHRHVTSDVHKMEHKHVTLYVHRIEHRHVIVDVHRTEHRQVMVDVHRMEHRHLTLDVHRTENRYVIVDVHRMEHRLVTLEATIEEWVVN